MKSFIEVLQSNIFKYIWALFLAIIIINLTGTLLYTRSEIIKSTDESIYISQKNISNFKQKHIDYLTSIYRENFNNTHFILQEENKILIEKSEFNDLMGLEISDVNGNIISSSSLIKDRYDQDKYYKKVVSTKLPFISNLLLDKVTNKQYFEIYAPIIKNGKAIAVIKGTFGFENLEKIINETNIRNDIKISLLDNKYKIIASQEFKSNKVKESVFSKIDLLFSNKVAVKNVDQGKFLGLKNGKLMYYTYSSTDINGWILLSGFDIFEGFSVLIIINFLRIIFLLVLLALFKEIQKRKLQRELSPIYNAIDNVSKVMDMEIKVDSYLEDYINNIMDLTIQGLTDNITGLPTRNFFMNSLNKLVKDYAPNTISAFYFIDMDNMKHINDTYGHCNGDLILKKFAKEIKSTLKGEFYLISRFGGDEFVVFLYGLSSENDVEYYGHLLNKNLDSYVLVNDQIVSYSSSIGCSIYPIHTDKIDELITFADQALYLSKESGKNVFTVYGKGGI